MNRAALAAALLALATPAMAGKCRDDSYNRARNSFVVSFSDRPAAHIPGGLPWAGCGDPNFPQGNQMDTADKRKRWKI